jgi:16S rRNA (cytosine967-C5)-methyltransferase
MAKKKTKKKVKTGAPKKAGPKAKSPVKRVSTQKKLKTQAKKASKASKVKTTKTPASPKKTSKASAAPAKAAPKATIAKKVEAVAERPLLSMSNPYKQFQDIWSPQQESFIHGLKKLFTAFEAPGKTQEQKEQNSAEIIDKIEAGLRKEPVPADILEQLEERFPADRVRQLASIFNLKTRQSIRLNSLRVDISGFGESKAGAEMKAKRCRLSPWGFDVSGPVNPLRSPLYERGLFEVEDESSQITALMTNARPGQRILDLCAREGDHTLALACMMKNKGSLFVYDSDPNKLKFLKQRAQRAGVENIRILSDSQVAEVKSLDVVLVDAPSSGSGLLARQPEIKWRFKKDELSKIHRLQAALLREAARKLKLGGHLIYVTNSLNRSENEGQIENFLKAAHNSYRLVVAADYLKDYVLPYVKNNYGIEWDPKTLESLLEFEPFLVCTPDRHACNGLFVAVLERTRISS